MGKRKPSTEVADMEDTPEAEEEMEDTPVVDMVDVAVMEGTLGAVMVDAVAKGAVGVMEVAEGVMEVVVATMADATTVVAGLQVRPCKQSLTTEADACLQTTPRRCNIYEYFLRSTNKRHEWTSFTMRECL
ncbi:hypothetical protein RJ640_002835 [Escallonia rubra]|uniref:Uncharacterized protein n=1 Tax=Escallonia rubra TaxID=112253 RepID=A0AA88U7F0_9ASTE|nr:hypothetical protein RJ640_002835 [Escallonia rubra]